MISFNLSRAFGEGIIMALFLGLISKKRPEFRVRYFVLCLFLELISVLSLYMGQEDSSFFFWHPYIVFCIADLSDYSTYKREHFEKLLLWPVFVIPVLSGIVLTVGWLIKLYHRNFFDILGI